MDLSLIGGALRVCRQVVLPGFGAFLQGNAADGGVLQLTFTPFILRSDGGFEGYLSSACGISLAAAGELAQQMAVYARGEVDRMGYCNLPGLGSLRREGNGLVLFSAEMEDAGGVALALEMSDASDLPSCVKGVCGRDESIGEGLGLDEVVGGEGMARGVVAGEAGDRYSNCAVPPVVMEPLSMRSGRSGGLGWVWLVLLVVLLTGAGYAAWHYGWVEGAYGKVQAWLGLGGDLGKAEDNAEEQGAQSGGALEGVSSGVVVEVEDSSLRREYDALASQVRKSQGDQAAASDGGGMVSLPRGDGNLPYHIVLGSFTLRENALAFARRMRGEGFAAVVLEGDDGAQRVALCSYARRSLAMEGLSHVRRTYGSAWLYCP